MNKKNYLIILGCLFLISCSTKNRPVYQSVEEYCKCLLIDSLIFNYAEYQMGFSRDPQVHSFRFPDSTWVYYTSNRKGKPRISSISIDTNKKSICYKETCYKNIAIDYINFKWFYYIRIIQKREKYITISFSYDVIGDKEKTDEKWGTFVFFLDDIESIYNYPKIYGIKSHNPEVIFPNVLYY